MTAGSRDEDFARVFSGPTDNKSRGGGKAAGSAKKLESTHNKEAAKGRNMGEDQESITAKQGDPQDARGRIGKDVVSQIKVQAEKKRLERLAKERVEAEKSGVNNAANKMTNPRTVIPPREDRQENPAATYNTESIHQESTSLLTSGQNNQEGGTAKKVGDGSGGGYNKRRSRSYSPVAITGTRHQHTQEIRTNQTSSASPIEGVASKWQGIGSPARGTKTYKPTPTQELASMSTHSSSSLSIKALDLTLGEDTEEASSDSSMKCNSAEGGLGQIKIYTTGTFNMKRQEMDEEIKRGGGQVTSNIKEANLVVVGTNPREGEMEYLISESIPYIDLELLFKVLQAEVSLSSIMDTQSKVSFASSTIGIQRGDSSSSKSKSRLKYGLPRRIPVGRSNSPSISSPSWNSKSVNSQGGTGFSKFGRTLGGGASPVDLTPKHTTFLNVRVTFPQTENPADIAQSSIGNLLKVFKAVDSHTILWHLDKETVRISREEDVPIMKMLYDTYAYFNGAKKGELQPYTNAKADRNRSISYTIRVGTQIPMNQLLDETIWELSRVIDGGNMNVEIKALQEARTETVFIIMASPTYFSLPHFTKVLAQFLQQGIDAAKQKKPTKYSYLPEKVPPFAMQQEFIKGLPFVKDEESDKIKITPYMRKPIHFVTKIDDYDDMKVILDLCERTDNVKYLFGGGTFFINNRATNGQSDMEIEALQNCVRRHIWAYKNTAYVTARGVRNLDGTSRIRKMLTDESGELCEDDEYQVDQEMSLRDVMIKIKVGDTPVFCLVARKDASYIAFHRNIHEEVKKYVKRFESEPAAHIMFWLLKRGIEEDDVVEFLNMAFDAEEVAAALDSRMENGIIISKRALEQEKLIARFDLVNPNVDITEAMREAEIADYKKKLVDSLKETAFSGRVGLTLDEKNTNWGSGSTIYLERNLTLGETELDFEEWGNFKDNFKEDFAGPNWDEEEVFKINIDTSRVPELDSNRLLYSSTEGRDEESLVEKSIRKPSQSLPKSALRNNKSKTSDGNDKVETLSRAAQEENSNINARENNIMETSEVADSAGENDEGREQAGIEDGTNSQTAAQMKDGRMDLARDEEAQKLEGERYSFTNNEGLDGKSWSTNIVKQYWVCPIPSGCTAISHSIIRRWDTYIG
jgi:hypothetical protein